MYRRVVFYFRRKWSSSDPIDRTIGLCGKSVIELGLAFIAGVVIWLLAVGVDLLIGHISLIPFPTLNFVIIAGPAAYMGNHFWCKIVNGEQNEEPTEEDTTTV